MIDSIALSELAGKAHGVLRGESVDFSKVSIDTRTLKEGDLFIAIKGESFDGHQFISKALQSGCCAVVLNSAIAANNSDAFGQNSTESVLIVEDTQAALAGVAELNRDAFQGPVIGLTGSSGKTSTKNMLSAILSESGETCATQGNFNNEIGVPLTLLNIEKKHDYAVVEMGARAPGDIRYLADFVKPDVAILLNAGFAHIDIFGSYDQIVATKGEIFDCLEDTGVGIINLDDPAFDVWISSLEGKKVISFSVVSSNADVYASDINCGREYSEYQLHYQGEVEVITLPVPGEHNISNSLAAAAAALSVGINLHQIGKGLSKLESVSGRLKMIRISPNLALIDDSYNANPASMKASLDVLCLQNGHKVAVLGEMAELGDYSRSQHLELAEYAKNTSVDSFYLIGPHAEEMASHIGNRAICAESKQGILDSLIESGSAEEIVLIKGSRSARMDELVDMIQRRVQ